jgi:hypothetical protein
MFVTTKTVPPLRFWGRANLISGATDAMRNQELFLAQAGWVSATTANILPCCGVRLQDLGTVDRGLALGFFSYRQNASIIMT